jgi:hypothetical protein
MVCLVRSWLLKLGLASAFVLGLPFFGDGSVAHAGYMAVGSEPSTDSLIKGNDVEKAAASQPGQMGAAQDTTEDTKNPKDQKIEIVDGQLPFARLNTTHGGCSNGASVPTSSTSLPVLAGPAQPVVCPAMVSWLIERNVVFSPSPQASGLFHPPRACGLNS